MFRSLFGFKGQTVIPIYDFSTLRSACKGGLLVIMEVEKMTKERMTKERIIEQSSEYTIIEMSFEPNGQLIDQKYRVEYKDMPKIDTCLTLEEAQDAIKKHFKKEGK